MLDRLSNNSSSAPGHFLDLPNQNSSVDLCAIHLRGASLFMLESSEVPKSLIARREIPPTVEQVEEGKLFHVTWTGSRYLNVRHVQSPQPLARPSNFKATEGSRPPAGSYFEVTVLENGGASRELDAEGNVLADDEEWMLAGTDFPDGDIGFLGIGLAMRPYTCFNHVGWNFGSFGFHSDDGKLFDGCLQGGFPWNGPYTLGDVVGVGLDPNGDVFVTNGSLCGPVVKGRIARIPASHFEWQCMHEVENICEFRF
ncbi:hypothetical protein HDU81_002406 [Chytriomyces hyalinus]|nr:hypothetical protein HDU81_002406 [Chytriomyces hyalinus]